MTALLGTMSYPVDQGRIDRWAEVSGDFNPLHVSPEYAAATSFGTTIAHGHYGLAQIEGLLLSVLGGQWLRGGVLQDLKFRAPVRPGTTCVVELSREATDGTVAVRILDAVSGTVLVTGTAHQGDGTLW